VYPAFIIAPTPEQQGKKYVVKFVSAKLLLKEFKKDDLYEIIRWEIKHLYLSKGFWNIVQIEGHRLTPEYDLHMLLERIDGVTLDDLREFF